MYTWLVRTFPSCPRPPAINDGDDDAFRGGQGSRDRAGGRKRRTPVDAERADSRDAGDARAGSELDLCLTRRGFVEMYRCIWQAAGRDIEVMNTFMQALGLPYTYHRPVYLSAERYVWSVCVERELLVFEPSRSGERTTNPGKRGGEGYRPLCGGRETGEGHTLSAALMDRVLFLMETGGSFQFIGFVAVTLCCRFLPLSLLLNPQSHEE